MADSAVCVALASILVLASPAPAQTPAAPSAPTTITLAAALEYARSHQPEIRRALAEIAAREAQARVPRYGWLPRVGMQAQLLYGTTNNTTGSFNNIAGVDVPRVSSTPVTATTSWALSPSSIVAVNVQQQLYEFGRLAAQAALADAQTEVARQSATAVQLDISLRVEEAYAAVLAAKRILIATQEAYKRAEGLYHMAETGVRSGMRPPIDRTRAQAELAQAAVQRTRAETGLTSAQAALAAVIGSSELLVDAAEMQPSERPFPGLDEALRIAQEHSPEVMAALARLRAQESETATLTRELLPNTYLSATLWGNAGGAPVQSADPSYGNGWLPSVGNASVSVVFQWRLLDPIVIARRRAAQQRQQVERAAVEVAQREIVLQAQRSYLDLEAAQKALPGLLSTVTAGKANLEQAQARFRAGLGTLIELTDAESLLVNAQLNLAVGQWSVARAAAQLARSLGSAQRP